MLRTSFSRRRSGFTLVELMTATALILFIMVIITSAFRTGLDTFRNLKAIGDMQERLRTASVVLRRDLAAEHFDSTVTAGAGLGGPYLSNQRLDRIGWMPPEKGFFRIVQRSTINATTAFFQEGVDVDGIPSNSAVNHSLSFSVRLKGNRREELFSLYSPTLANDPRVSNHLVDFQDGVNLHSRWAEISYFLTPVAKTAGTTPLYVLRRKQRLLVPDALNSYPFSPSDYPSAGISVSPTNNSLNTASNICIPENRVDFGVPGVFGAEKDALGQETGNDILLTDVISFEIKATWLANTDFNTASAGLSPPVSPINSGNMSYPFDDIPLNRTNTDPKYANLHIFDTWTSRQIFVGSALHDYSKWDPIQFPLTATPTPNPNFYVPLRICIQALQITIRVWDEKTQQARQVTIIQDV